MERQRVQERQDHAKGHEDNYVEYTVPSGMTLTMSSQGVPGTDEKIVDTVSCTNLVKGRGYTVSSILSNAAAFIAVHNHPSGSPQPSEEDIATTRRLQECGELMNIKMLDHIS
jgi:DNA repair protein RadC